MSEDDAMSELAEAERIIAASSEERLRSLLEKAEASGVSDRTVEGIIAEAMNHETLLS